MLAAIFRKRLKTSLLSPQTCADSFKIFSADFATITNVIWRCLQISQLVLISLHRGHPCLHVVKHFSHLSRTDSQFVQLSLEGTFLEPLSSSSKNALLGDISLFPSALEKSALS